MRTTATIEKPGDVEVTIAVTMTVSEWEKLRMQMPSGWPSTSFSSAIGDAIGKVRRVVYGAPDGEA